MDAADILEATANELERSGHLKFDLGRNSGPKCLNGAMNYAETLNTQYPHNWSAERRRAVDSLFAYLGLSLSYHGICACAACKWYTTTDSVIRKSDQLAKWNNAEDRDPGEIIDACRHTAKVLRGN